MNRPSRDMAKAPTVRWITFSLLFGILGCVFPLLWIGVVVTIGMRVLQVCQRAALKREHEVEADDQAFADLGREWSRL